jgi:hypothetical protein
MKTTKVLQAICLLLILVISVGCRNSRSTTGKQYPRSGPPTETATKTETVYVDGANLPPGQAKKVYGDKSAKAYAPGQQKKYETRYPLVIVITPGLVISKYNDGRYYYKNAAGHIYWKGHDGRYYLDEKHLKGVKYDESEYDEWKFKGQKNTKAQEPKEKEQEVKVKEDQKPKNAEAKATVKEQKGKGETETAREDDQKGKDQADQKSKDDNSQKGKAKPKVKGK